MKAGMRPIALVGILGALGAASAAAQSSAQAQVPAATPVTPAVTVVAQRVPVVTVLAPRETPSGAPAGKRQNVPASIGKADDADGERIADAPAVPARAARTAPSSDERATRARAASAAPGADCGEKDPRTAPASPCARGNPNPVHQDKVSSGVSPPHER